MIPPLLPKPVDQIIVTTGNSVQGQMIERYLGIVRGVVVRSTGLSRGISGSLKAISGGNVPEFSRVCEEARQAAYDLMIQQASRSGADAVIGFRYDAAGFIEGCSEVIAYGTAVTLSQVEEASTDHPCSAD